MGDELKDCIIQIPRMAFVHWSRIYFNVSYTINGSRQDGQRFMSILYEVVYKGWNDTDDRSSELRALTIVNGEPTKGTGRTKLSLRSGCISKLKAYNIFVAIILIKLVL